jgi:hypothetical protein
VNRGNGSPLERSLRALAHRPMAYVHERLPAVVQRGGADEARPNREVALMRRILLGEEE